MDLRQITPTLSVASQITQSDIADLHAAGFRTVICNRPDGEVPGQPTYDDIAEAAQAAGIETVFLPVTPGTLTDDTVAAFGDALRDMPGPVLAYCRSGTRSTTVWALAMADRMPIQDILDQAGAAGYDMSGVAPRIMQNAKSAG